MDALYHQTNRQLQELLEREVRLIEQAKTFGDMQNADSVITNKIDLITKNLDQLKIMVLKEPPQRRTTAKYKVDQLNYDLQHILSSYRALQAQHTGRLHQAEQREQLLSQTYTTNDKQATAIFMDHELNHHTSLQDSNRSIDELLNVGSSVLANLREQGSLLKGAQKKMLDLANTLGLSHTVMRLIERRPTQDAYILYGGMVIVLLVLLLIVLYA